jgi:hypothetical protein
MQPVTKYDVAAAPRLNQRQVRRTSASFISGTRIARTELALPPKSGDPSGPLRVRYGPLTTFRTAEKQRSFPPHSRDKPFGNLSRAGTMEGGSALPI